MPFAAQPSKAAIGCCTPTGRTQILIFGRPAGNRPLPYYPSEQLNALMLQERITNRSVARVDLIDSTRDGKLGSVYLHLRLSPAH
jgi:hypothetical protein